MRLCALATWTGKIITREKQTNWIYMRASKAFSFFQSLHFYIRICLFAMLMLTFSQNLFSGSTLLCLQRQRMPISTLPEPLLKYQPQGWKSGRLLRNWLKCVIINLSLVRTRNAAVIYFGGGVGAGGKLLKVGPGDNENSWEYKQITDMILFGNHPSLLHRGIQFKNNEQKSISRIGNEKYVVRSGNAFIS